MHAGALERVHQAGYRVARAEQIGRVRRHGLRVANTPIQLEVERNDEGGRHHRSRLNTVFIKIAMSKPIDSFFW